MSDLFYRLLNENRITECGRCISFDKDLDPYYGDPICTYYDKPTYANNRCTCQEYRYKDDTMLKEDDYAYTLLLKALLKIDRMKYANERTIDSIREGIIEMHDGGEEYAEKIFNKAMDILLISEESPLEDVL